MPRRLRLDKELVRRRLTATRSEAQTLVAAGRVRVGGALAEKPSRLVDPAEALHVTGGPPRYASRGGIKLEAALSEFRINPSGVRAIDVGASTGGFTDCLLQHGATEVVAVDVGRHQLHERLRADPRVKPFDRTDVRAVSLDDIGGPAVLVTADLSFISLRLVAADLLRLSSADMILLVKPQFEAGRHEASRHRGVIRDPAVWERVLLAVIAAMQDEGAALAGMMVSPITGAAGNVEFFLHMQAHSDISGFENRHLDTSVSSVVSQASLTVNRQPRNNTTDTGNTDTDTGNTDTDTGNTDTGDTDTDTGNTTGNTDTGNTTDTFLVERRSC